MLDRQPSLFPQTTDPLDFRVVHYLGSKLRLMGAVRSAVEQLVPPRGRVCDLFAGSGAVSLGLRHAWSVTAVDIQEYSRVLCSALLNPRPPAAEGRERLVDARNRSELRRRLVHALEPVITYERATLDAAERGSMDALCDLLEHGSLLLDTTSTCHPGLASARQETLRRLAAEELDRGAASVITRYYGGVYFSWQQALDLDVLLDEAHAVDPSSRDHVLAPALSVASDVVNTVGKQFAQPIRPRDAKGRPKLHLVRQTLRDRGLDVMQLYAKWLDRYDAVPTPAHRHRALRGDFADVLRERVHEFDLVYADPPYTRDHYSRYYHVLETMALRDEPQVSTTTIRTGGRAVPSRGLYRAERHQSPFCIKSQAPAAFDALCRAVADARTPLLLSYSPYKEEAGNRPRLLTVAELREIAARSFDLVTVVDVAGVTHNKFNVDERNVAVDYAAEILMVCRPR